MVDTSEKCFLNQETLQVEFLDLFTSLSTIVVFVCLDYLQDSDAATRKRLKTLPAVRWTPLKRYDR